MQPSEVVELLRDFRPAFCPWPDCQRHLAETSGSAFQRHGTYRRRDGAVVPRFRCRACGRTFSRQSFAISYYLKRPELSEPIAKGLVAGSGHRQIARSIGCHHSTVTRRAQRLGRHALLLQQLALRDVTLGETVVVDDFDSFAGSQYCPCTLPTATGADSWFVYGTAFARERRRGHLSPVQHVRRARFERTFGRPERGSVERAFRSLIGRLPAAAGTPIRLVADDDPAIRRAAAAFRSVTLSAFPNPRRGPKGSPRTPEARARDAALFPNDQLHRFLRHSEAAHRRETIAFGRSYNGLVERVVLFIVWRNLVQARSERHPRDGTAAMRLGLTDSPWTWRNVLAERLFPSRVRPPVEVMDVYRRTLITPHLRTERRHALKHAI